ncbi:MAG: hypothetical protein M1823_003583 [Watsoniomyces obsoletus]|nr:MAG: hypothetical protein M1823_003583 [Watsoniomyces obsoletus]
MSDRVNIGAFPEAEPLSRTWTQHALWKAVHARKSDYTSRRKACVKIGSWNVAAIKGTEDDLTNWFVRRNTTRKVSATSSAQDVSPEGTHQSPEAQEPVGDSDPHHQGSPGSNDGEQTEPSEDEQEVDIYVLGLQEIVDVTSPSETLRPYTDPAPSQRWKNALLDALPPGYVVVAEQQLVGLLLLIAASPSMAPLMSSVSTTSVGTGLLGYMGNKGAVGARIVLGETTSAIFINCHLAAGSDATSLDRRNWDAAQILQRTKFEAIVNEAGTTDMATERIGEEDLAWWFGDLNYRLEGMSGDDVRRLLTLHMKDEYNLDRGDDRKIKEELIRTEDSNETKGSGVSSGSSNPGSTSVAEKEKALDRVKSHSMSPSGSSSHQQRSDPTPDPTSLDTTLGSLLPHDQLHKQQAAHKAFHEGWREGPIRFLPTYKYDIGSVGVFDSSEKKRGPSWCDRILFRSRQDLLKYNELQKSRERDEKEADDSEVTDSEEDIARLREEADLLFDYDPETDGAGDERTLGEAAGDSESNEGPESDIHLVSYTSDQQTSSSDHKPLVGLFNIVYELADPKRKKKVYEEVAREFDKLENAERPGVTVVVEHVEEDKKLNRRNPSSSQGTDTISFGDVRYAATKYRNITVANTSRVSARLIFVGTSGDAEVMPSWLRWRWDNTTQEPDDKWKESVEEMFIAPGESLNISFRLCVEDIDTVRALNEDSQKLEHVLVLRVIDGRDHFIPVEASWMQSCFGRSLEELTRIPDDGGVRSLQQQSKDTSKSGRRTGSASTPTTIVQLTTTIMQLIVKVLAAWSMTEDGKGESPPWEGDSGWPFSNKSWRSKDIETRRSNKLHVLEAMDTDQSPCSLFDPSTTPLEQLEIVAEVLINFLDSLKDGIVPETLWTTMEQEISDHQKSKKPAIDIEEERAGIFDILSTSPVHNIAFVFLTSMLARVAAEIISSDIQDSGSRTSPTTKVVPLSPSSPSKVGGGGDGKFTAATTKSSTRRHSIDRAYAEIFAPVMIRGRLPSRDRDRKVTLERRRHAIEIFLQNE